MSSKCNFQIRNYILASKVKFSNIVSNVQIMYIFSNYSLSRSEIAMVFQKYKNINVQNLL